MVQADVIAEQRVRPERHMVDADQIDAVLEVLHERLDGVAWVLAGERGVRRGLDADHAAFFGALLEHVVGLHAPGIPQSARAGMGDEDRLLR